MFGRAASAAIDTLDNNSHRAIASFLQQAIESPRISFWTATTKVVAFQHATIPTRDVNRPTATFEKLRLGSQQSKEAANPARLGYISGMTSDSTRRTVLFAGGGTGGHLFPGIAVARELLAREPDARVLFVGSQKPIEQDIVGGAGFEHVALPSVSPSLAPTRIGSTLFGNWRAYRQARSIISRERPNVVIGLGGFASVPPVLAARRSRVPIVLLEQNVIPGKATRWLSRFADVVCLPWAETAQHLSSRIRTVVTGNPIRREIADRKSVV